MRQRVKRRPRIYFSFRSPFSWLALTALERAVPQVWDLADLVPYWDPDAATERALADRGAEVHYAQMSKAKHLYILQDTKRTAQSLGLGMAWPVDVAPWWEVPHLAWLSARRQGMALPFYREVMRARWERGENVCDRAVVAGIGDRIGLDGRVLAAATEDPEIRAEGVDGLYTAWEDDIFGVPYFRIGRQRFWGYDRVSGFAVELVAMRDSVPEPVLVAEPVLAPVPVGAYDTDTAGGCG
jgi:2-hydroxychromene-2-carboxylate isomerase